MTCYDLLCRLGDLKDGKDQGFSISLAGAAKLVEGIELHPRADRSAMKERLESYGLDHLIL